MSNTNQLLKGSLSAIILKLLSDNDKMYGYEICQKVKLLTEGQIRVTEGALYPALHKLEGEGILVTHTEVVDGRTRKYYAISENEQGNAKSKLSQMAEFMEKLQLMLNTDTSQTKLAIQ